MPSKKSRKSGGGGRKRRRERRPNVYTGPANPAGRRAAEDEPADAPSVGAPSAAGAVESRPAAARRIARSRARAGARSEVYARTLPLELRKIGILSVGVVVSLAVLTVVLG